MIAPISHFFMGGIATDINGEMGIQGLYAAGEVVGGVHGANRHGGNALTAITVFGARAGKVAADYSKRTEETIIHPTSELDRYNRLRGQRPEGGIKPREMMDQLRALMWEKAGIVRTKDGLEKSLTKINGFRDGISNMYVDTSRDMLVALELPMALDVSEMIIRSALERKESRGAHFRVDYPEIDADWVKTVILRKKANTMYVTNRPLR